MVRRLAWLTALALVMSCGGDPAPDVENPATVKRKKKKKKKTKVEVADASADEDDKPKKKKKKDDSESESEPKAESAEDKKRKQEEEDAREAEERRERIRKREQEEAEAAKDSEAEEEAAEEKKRKKEEAAEKKREAAEAKKAAAEEKKRKKEEAAEEARRKKEEEAEAKKEAEAAKKKKKKGREEVEEETSDEEDVAAKESDEDDEKEEKRDEKKASKKDKEKDKKAKKTVAVAKKDTKKQKEEAEEEAEEKKDKEKEKEKEKDDEAEKEVAEADIEIEEDEGGGLPPPDPENESKELDLEGGMPARDLSDDSDKPPPMLAIDRRPLTQEKGRLDVHGGLRIASIKAGMTTATSEGLGLGATYGVTPKVQVGLDYTIGINPGSAKGPFALSGAFQVKHSEKLDVALSAGFAIDFITSTDPMTMMTSTTTVKALQFGVWTRYHLGAKASVFTGLPALPNASGGLSGAAGLPPLPYHLSLGLGQGATIALEVPVGIGYQASPKLYAMAMTSLAHIDMKNSTGAFLFADYIPFSLGGFYAKDAKLDIGAVISDDVKQGLGYLRFDIVARYYLK
ncbi:MAG TPA: hypothetical protein VMZ53_32335 [Kofleriaceae bacterium]|nr:hypothetical protein [Kofleriaceae bacterium]